MGSSEGRPPPPSSARSRTKARSLADLFADSYAFFARAEGNPRYIRVFASHATVTSALNVLEVYAVMLRRLEPSVALRHARACAAYLTPVPDDVAFDAAKFKRRMVSEGRSCSTVDAWGYAASRRLGCRFLTGDQQFKGLPGVAFLR